MPDEAVSVTISAKQIRKIAGTSNMKKAMAVVGAIAEGEAKRLAPVDTGNLRRSITHEVLRDSAGYFARYGTNVFYGIYQELGTRYHAAQPFLRPALGFVKNKLRGGI